MTNKPKYDTHIRAISNEKLSEFGRTKQDLISALNTKTRDIDQANKIDGLYKICKDDPSNSLKEQKQNQVSERQQIWLDLVVVFGKCKSEQQFFDTFLSEFQKLTSQTPPLKPESSNVNWKIIHDSIYTNPLFLDQTDSINYSRLRLEALEFAYNVIWQ